MLIKRVIHDSRDIGNIITELAKQRNIKMVSIEEKVDLSAGLVTRWKNGQCSPRLSNILEIMELLNMELVVRPKLQSEESERRETIADEILAFLNQQNLDLKLGPLEQRIKNILHSDASKIISQLLFFEMSLEEKKVIREMLELMILLDENK